MKKSILTTILVLFSAIHCLADRPEWTYQTPKARNDTYLYKKTRGVGKDEISARNDAWVQMFKLAITIEGIEVESNEIYRAVQSGSSFESISAKYRLPINESCSFPTYENGQYVYYLLCQVPNNIDVKGEPKFEEFTDCNKMAKNPYTAYAFIPGMAQIKKCSVAKGSCFIIGEVAFLGGIVAAESLRASYVNKINSTHNAALRTQYIQNANLFGLARNISIAGAVAVYAWNVIDGMVAKAPQMQFTYNDAIFRFAPYTGIESSGLALNIRF